MCRQCRRQIRRHYLSYAIAPSFVGALLGTLVGHYTLPFFLWDALISQNEMPYQLTPPISLAACGMTLLTVVMSVGILLLSYRSAARETTAALLRPKPPKDGKRILLERITPLWSRFSFNAKMVVRNLMRNKLRTFMSYIGLLCCTMLIITSLGLQDSVTRMTTNYYTGTLNYDVLRNTPVKWNIAANLSFNRNRIGGLDGDQYATSLWSAADQAFLQRNGCPIGTIFGYVEDGFFDNLAEVRSFPAYAGLSDTEARRYIGEIKYRDMNGDGQITAADKTIIGDTNPDFVYGFTSNLSWKNFTLSFIRNVTFLARFEKAFVFSLFQRHFAEVTRNEIPR